MKKSLLATAILLILLLAVWWGKSRSDPQAKERRADNSAASEIPSDDDSAASDERSAKTGARPGRSTTERSGPAGIKKLSNAVHTVEEEATDKVTASTAKATVRLGKGQSMLTGGYLDSDGRRVFSVIVPKRIDSVAEPTVEQVMLSCTVVALDPQQLREAGLDRLITDRKADEAEAGIWSVDDAAATLATLPAESYRSRPTVMTLGGQKASVETRSEGVAETLEFSASPTEEGGFDMVTGWRHAVGEKNPSGE